MSTRIERRPEGAASRRGVPRAEAVGADRRPLPPTSRVFRHAGTGGQRMPYIPENRGEAQTAAGSEALEEDRRAHVHARPGRLRPQRRGNPPEAQRLPGEWIRDGNGGPGYSEPVLLPAAGDEGGHLGVHPDV